MATDKQPDASAPIQDNRKKYYRLSTFALIALLVLGAIAAYLLFQEFGYKVFGIDILASTEKLRVPPGFKIETWAKVPGARQMCLGPKGTLFVGTREVMGSVYAVTTERNGARRVIKIASKMNMPNGVAMRGNSLYIGEVSKISRLDDIESHLNAPPQPVVVNDRLPTEMAHGWKYIGFGPDGMLYVPVGAPCNVCIRKDDARFAAMSRMKPDGTGEEIFAKGIRNTVGFDWDPQTKDLWFTDNGRDWLGDNLPPDELNHAPRKGMHFGFPYRWGDVVDKEFGKKAPPGQEFTPPAQCLDPHVAALGMKFYTGKMFPEEYRNQIFIAEHGSWNRSHKIGYRVSLVRMKDGKCVKYEPFIDGWLTEQGPMGRPVDVLIMPDGSMLISDDFGLIYRVTYTPPAK